MSSGNNTHCYSDPSKVTRDALQNAISVAAIIPTREVYIVGNRLAFLKIDVHTIYDGKIIHNLV